MNHYSESALNQLSTNTEHITKEDWTNWKWQLKKRVKNVDQLKQFIHLTDDERRACDETQAYFRWQITPYYASLMDPNDPDCPIRRQVVPKMEELEDDFDILNLDPLEEMAHSPVKNVIHNYNDRVAFCVASECAVYCRYCLRKRMVGDGTHAMNKEELQQGINYIARTPEIRDVLLTGGDPLTLNDRNLEWIISRLRKIDHVDIIRIGSRFPVLNPFRITDDLCRILEDYGPIWFNTHYNHPKELTPEAKEACDKITKTGTPLGNQTVLLKGLNDDAETLKELFHGLVTMKVRPYYLYQAQLLGGTKHFRTSIEHGMELMEQLRGRLSGFAIPTYVLDTPYGKVPLTPNGFLKRDGNYVEVMSYQGKKWREYNPE